MVEPDDETFAAAPPKSMAERLAILAGRTAFREPIGGHTNDAGRLQWSNELAAALAFARQHPSDIGPDIACAISTGTPAHRQKIVTELTAALLAGRGRLAERNADYLPMIAADAYLIAVGYAPTGKPEGMAERDYLALRWQGECWLREAADNALRRASAALG